MNQLEYLPGIGGQAIQLDGPVAFVGTADKLRGREWNYDLGYRDLLNANRPARVVDVTLWTDADTANALRRVADADVMAGKPGTFVAQNEWRQHGYILASDVDDIHYGRLSTGLKIALLDGAWWRLVKRSFVPEITTPEYRSATGETVTASGASGAPLHALTVDGKAVQDGTPTPANPIPIGVVQGVNLLNPKLYSGGGYNPTVGTQWTLTDSPIQFTANSDKTVYSIETTATWRTYTLLFPIADYLNDALWISMTFKSTGTAGISRGYLDASFNVLSVFNNTNTTYQINGGFGNIPSDAAYYYIVITNRGTAQTTLSLTEPLINKGTSASEYFPYGVIDLKINDSITPIDLNGNVLASLPDGTHDELNVDSNGAVAITKRVGYTNQATTDGISATVGTDAISSTGTLDDGADVYYKLTTEQTITLTSITMPAIPLDAQISVTAAVTPTITAEWQTSPDVYLDYPHDYEYDYQKTSYTGGITPSVFTPSEPYLVVYGPAVNPYVIVGGNRYQVNVTVPSGGYLIVDGREKTITLTLADGTVQNVFSSGVRGGGAGGGTYIFEKIPAGTSEVAFDGSFGFDIGWYEEEGEPPWSQS